MHQHRVGVFIGTIGIFFTLFLLFARFFPVLALNELKTILKSSGEHHKEMRPSPTQRLNPWNPPRRSSTSCMTTTAR